MIREGWYRRIGLSLLIWIIAVMLCMFWRWVSNKSEIVSYWVLFGVLTVLWIVIGCAVSLYRSYKDISYWRALFAVIADEVILIALCWIWSFTFHQSSFTFQFSPRVAMWTIFIVGTLEALVVLMEHYWKYATNMMIPPIRIEQRKNAVVTREEAARRPESIHTIRQSVLSVTSEAEYDMLRAKARLDSTRTKVICNRDRFAFIQIPDYQYETLVDLTLLNDTRGINRRFCTVNQKLPDNGIYVCCYRPQEYMKQKIMNSYPKGLNWIVYSLYFLQKRVIPRLLLTSRLYYDLTKGKKRMLSKTEVLGRLYYCGFQVDEVLTMGHIEYVFAHRHSQPYPQEQIKVYGPLIKLPRVCENKQIKYFYKFRTMHPYAEYIQNYVFDTINGMDIADKSNGDWRITNWGRLLRKYWLDELPMLINWAKRDLKLVGVRPLSQAMFDTYPQWLQDKRTRTKPGLIPPFYIDHPDTFDELFQSEDQYLTEYLAHPIRTDIKYFFLTTFSILTRKTHSA